jgi:DnaJ-class molecular chaperone
MEYKNYYKILGVPKNASGKEIKAAYRRLARKHHPDVNPGSKQAEARFKEINEANDVLSDPEKRRRYDQMGESWPHIQSRGGRSGGGRVRVDFGGIPGSAQSGSFSDFFQTFFGGEAGGATLEDILQQARGGRAQRRGGDEVEHELTLTLEEAHRGVTRTLAVAGQGSTRRVEVKVPAGVREGQRVRLAGEGGPAAEPGARADLYLRVRIAPHPVFEPKGDDLHTMVKVPLTTAVLGGEAEVATLDGPRGIKVPAGTPVGRAFRLRGEGLHRREGSGRGDLFATLSVDLPGELSRKERELFEELRGLGR